MAGGADEKWTSLGGQGRRHFQIVCGERVIDRIIRQLRARGVSDIWVIAPFDAGYDDLGVTRISPAYDQWGHEGLNGQEAWSPTERTLMVYGDTIFASKAMDTITDFSARTFQMFGRFGNGVIKGGGGELFAFSFWPEHRDAWAAAVLESFRLKEAGLIKRGGSWEGYRIMAGAQGARVGLHRYYPAVFTNINDRLTDDFDNPSQFVRLKRLFETVDKARTAA